MSTSKLYTLLIAASLCFNVACDGDETVTNDGGTPMAGTPMAGTPMAGTPMGGTPMGGTPMGGTPMAGTPMGGTPMGGTPMGGDPMGGDPMGGVELEPRVGMGDTAPLSCEGTYCPSARLSGLELPASRSEATTRGCRLAGSENGSSLSGLIIPLLMSTNLDMYVNPDDNGEIPLVLLNQLEGWMNGETGNEAEELTANFYVGDYVDGATYIDPLSFDETGAPYIAFPGTTVTDGLMSTPVSSFALTLPIFPGFDLSLSLENASIVGDLAVDENGFSLTDGVLGGYLTKDSLIRILDGIYGACGIGRDPISEPPTFCAQVRALITGNVETDLSLLQTFVKFDSIISETDASPCTPEVEDRCNAVSICLLVEMEPTAIRGITGQ